MNKDTTVILWLYHTDLAQEFYDLLKPLEGLINIHLCLCKDNDNKEAVDIFKELKNVKRVQYYPNIGADIYSFLEELSFIETPYFLKLHSKKSFWGTNYHCNWRKVLLDTFIGDKNTFVRNTNILRSGAGYLGCRCLTYLKKEGHHSDKINDLLKLIGCPKIKTHNKKFTGGNMFGGNTALFQRALLHNKNELLNLVSTESGKIDEDVSSTYCHSLERIFGYIGSLYEYRFLYAAPTCLKILNPDKDRRSLNFRILPNNDIYCVDQANIYGKIYKKNKHFMNIKWLNVKDSSVQYYIPIGKNCFINNNHFS